MATKTIRIPPHTHTILEWLRLVAVLGLAIGFVYAMV